eukprot:SM000221S06951  [mRNA]  locus=s221:118454:120155:- [translate_table: standard]
MTEASASGPGGAASGPAAWPEHVRWQAKLYVLLYVPNVIDYARAAMMAVAFTFIGSKHPRVFAGLYLLCFFLDGVDGYAARLLKQVSSFGAFLDVALDCSIRTAMWASAIDGPTSVIVPCIEWLCFLATHSQGGSAWKTGCFTEAPPWVSRVLQNGFRSPAGVLVISGLHFLPLWLWLRTFAPRSMLSAGWLGIVLVYGRVYCLAVELWTIGRLMNSMVTTDCVEANKPKAM